MSLLPGCPVLAANQYYLLSILPNYIKISKNLSGFQFIQSKDEIPYKGRPYRKHSHPLASLIHISHKGWLFLSPFSDKSTLTSGWHFLFQTHRLGNFPSSYWDAPWFHMARTFAQQQWANKPTVFAYSCVSWGSWTGGHWHLS